MFKWYYNLKENWKRARLISLELQVQDLWDKKTDEQIIIAYEDAIEWIDILEHPIMSKNNTDLLNSIKHKFEKYIEPQMIKRKLPLG